jgi:hypothetical protein
MINLGYVALGLNLDGPSITTTAGRHAELASIPVDQNFESKNIPGTPEWQAMSLYVLSGAN